MKYFTLLALGLLLLPAVVHATDADGDGMEDAWELNNGLNPNDPADAMGCPYGIIPNLWYYSWDQIPGTGNEYLPDAWKGCQSSSFDKTVIK